SAKNASQWSSLSQNVVTGISRTGISDSVVMASNATSSVTAAARLSNPCHNSIRSAKPLVGHEGIVLSLMAKRRGGAMTRHEHDRAAPRQQCVASRSQGRVVAAAREIGGPDRTLEQDVADRREPLAAMKEPDVARRMAGTEQTVERLLAETRGMAS